MRLLEISALLSGPFDHSYVSETATTVTPWNTVNSAKLKVHCNDIRGIELQVVVILNSFALQG